MHRPRPAVWFYVMVVVFFWGRASFGSDAILLHGHIYTGNPKTPWVQAVAITGGRIDAVGSDQEISSHREANTKVIDLQGRTVIPGIIDSHTHVLFGAMEIHGFDLSTPESSITADTPDVLVAKIKEFAASHPNDKILFGRADFSTVPATAPNHELLDRAVSDRPVIIHNTSEHALWVNAKALALAGLTEWPVVNPAEDRYVIRDDIGHPTGVLLESAMEVMERAVMASLTLDEKLTLLRDASHYLNTYGITSFVNATGSLEEIQLYAALRDRGELTVRTKVSFGAVAVNHRLTPDFLADLDKARTLYHDDWVSADLVKFFSDGGTGPLPPLTYPPAEYTKIVTELDARGYQLMTHSTRLDSAHMVLDAYQSLEEANGPRDRRLRMEHADYVSPEDMPRFSKLSVIVSMQPTFCCDKIPQDGENRVQSFAKSGVVVAFGSDWPCSWPPDPFIGIQEAVTRQVWKPASSRVSREFTMGYGYPGQGGSTPTSETYLPEEAFTVEQAVNAYTQGSAYAEFADSRLGTLDPGKEADLAVLSQDIFAAPHGKIANTHVVMTMVGGRVVFDGRK